MEADTRVEPKLAASERETLLACLDYQRDTVLQKFVGAAEEALRRRVVFRIEPEETTEQVVVLFRDEVARSRAIIAGADLDDRGRTTRTSRGAPGLISRCGGSWST